MTNAYTDAQRERPSSVGCATASNATSSKPAGARLSLGLIGKAPAGRCELGGHRLRFGAITARMAPRSPGRPEFSVSVAAHYRHGLLGPGVRSINQLTLNGLSKSTNSTCHGSPGASTFEHAGRPNHWNLRRPHLARARGAPRFNLADMNAPSFRPLYEYAAMPRPLTPTCAPDADHHRYDVWHEYEDDEHSLEGSGDGDDY